jgi:adenine-specific DNA-methyltransferase
MQSFLKQLESALTKDERLVRKGEILKNKVIELAIKLDKGLIELLLADKQMKEVFFAQAGKATIFDKDKFIKFVSSKDFLPDSYTAFKNKIGLTEDDEFISEKKEVVLSWPYKDCVLEGGMTKEDQKRDEIFWNQTLAPDEISCLLDPKVFTSAKRIDAKGEHKLEKFKTDEDGNIKDNLIIKGNNLLALHSLKKRFAGKVKCIYIDPPYGKKAHAFYNDSFKNSTWLTFMKDRLMVAKRLLSSDGIFFVQIDDEQYAYLKVLCDDNSLFGRENYISTITVQSKTPSGVGQESMIFDVTERILVYAKNVKEVSKRALKIFDEIVDENSRTVNNYKYIVENFGSDGDGYELKTGKGRPIRVTKLKGFKYSSVSKKDCTKRWAFENFEKIFRLSPANGGLMKKITPQLPEEPCYIEYVPEKGKYANEILRLYFIGRDMVVLLSEAAVKNVENGYVEKLVNIHNNWTDDNLWSGIAKEGGVQLKNGKKPEELIRRIVELTSQKGELILDFFLGSGTTCAVAHKMGRQYIGIEQIDYGENDGVVRLKNVINGDRSGISKAVDWKGGDNFVYMELSKWNEKWTDRIKKAESGKELEKIWDELKSATFLSYKVEPKKVDKYKKEFGELTLEQQKEFLQKECLDQNHLYINYSEIDDAEYGVSAEDKKLNKEFYG